MQQFSRNFSISSLTMHFDIYPNAYFVNEPQVLFTIWDGTTQATSVVNNQSVIAGIGSVYTSIDITFPSGMLGKKGSLLVTGE